MPQKSLKYKNHNFYIKVFLMAAIFSTSIGCEFNILTKAEGGNPPRFTFGGYSTYISELTIYHIPKESVTVDSETGTKLIRCPEWGDLLSDKEKRMWSIDGRCPARGAIEYGVVPDGMMEKISAKPLIEGEYYFVFGHAGVPGLFVPTYFTIREGKVIELKWGGVEGYHQKVICKYK